jgi:hypothetical protein
VRLARERTITPGGAVVRFLNVFSTIEETCVNDRPRGVIVRFLSVFSTIEETSVNDHPRGVIVRFLSVPLPTMSEPN